MAEKIDDLIVLGRAGPEPISDGRETVCLGGYSKSYGWVRLYPTQRRMRELRRWNVVSVPVERDEPNDSREESYKIAGSKEDWPYLHKKVEKVDRLEQEDQIKLVHELATDCPAQLNEDRLSLGMVEPSQIKEVYLKETAGEGVQLDLTMQERKGKSDYDYKLYIRYRCQGCVQTTPHDQHCIEWGVYKYWDNNDDWEGVIDALRLKDDEYKHYFFVGNLNHRRTAYIIISIMRFKKSDMLAAGIQLDEQPGLENFI